MGLTLRSSLDLPLTNDQLDANFTFLNDELNKKLSSDSLSQQRVVSVLDTDDIVYDANLSPLVSVRSVLGYEPSYMSIANTILLRGDDETVLFKNATGNLEGKIKLDSNTVTTASLKFNQTQNMTEPTTLHDGDMWLTKDGLFLKHNDGNISSTKRVLTLSEKSPFSASDKISIPPSLSNHAYLNISVGDHVTTPKIGDIWHTSEGILYLGADGEDRKIFTMKNSYYVNNSNIDKNKLIIDGVTNNALFSIRAGENPKTLIAGDMWATARSLFYVITGNTPLKKQIAFTDSDITGTAKYITDTLQVDKGGTGLTISGAVDSILVSNGVKWVLKTIDDLKNLFLTRMTEKEKFEMYPMGTVLPFTFESTGTNSTQVISQVTIDVWLATNTNWKKCDGSTYMIVESSTGKTTYFKTNDLRGRTISGSYMGSDSAALGIGTSPTNKGHGVKTGYEDAVTIQHSHDYVDGYYLESQGTLGEGKDGIDGHETLPVNHWGGGSTDDDNNIMWIKNRTTTTVGAEGRNKNIQPTIYMDYIQKIANGTNNITHLTI